ncbi:MAG: heavy metal translocating P-type ATPase metal-binding domain-containing protein [Bdellovibrionota bacterium]
MRILKQALSPSREEMPAHPERSYCVHCGTKVIGELLFCCHGCEIVHELLTSSGLGRYYELRLQHSIKSALKPVILSDETYAYLDSTEFKAKYTRNSGTAMDFYLEGVHCAACLWLIEKLPMLVPDLVSASLDIGRSVLRITTSTGGSFCAAAKTLEKLGYKPHPLQHDKSAEKLQKRENRRALIRLGVAGALAGNIMLMTVPLYSGLNGGAIATSFRWLSFLFFLPIVFYSAVPFYQSAWASIRTRTLSIDLPIVLAIILGTGVSFVHLLTHSSHLYFDSLAMLVFLLLSSRYALRRIQQTSLFTSHLYQFLAPTIARRIDPENGNVVELPATSLITGDLIRVNTQDVLPADGKIRRGCGEINCAILTGEPFPQAVDLGDAVFAGTVNEGLALEVEVTAVGRDTRLGQILRELENGTARKPAIVTSADRAAKWFLTVVFIMALVILALSPTFEEGFSRALALIIVTCPCALALATPLALSVSLGKAARHGILIKGAEVLEKISLARTIALDKTGTLTEGRLDVLEWSQTAGDVTDSDLKNSILALERRSKHPIAHALLRYLEQGVANSYQQVENFLVEDFKEQPGLGIEGRINGRHLVLRPAREIEGTAVGIFCGDTRIGHIRLGDRVRTDSAESTAELVKLGFTPYLISGDNHSAVAAIGRDLGLRPEQLIAEASPEFKKKFMDSNPRSIMVGDGANDALALSSAFVGVAVHGSMEISIHTADVYLTMPGLNPVVRLIRIARETMHTIHRNFAFSLFYNIFGACAAATGHMTPLFAAALMPLSAFTVFGSSLLGTRALHAALNGPGKIK